MESDWKQIISDLPFGSFFFKVSWEAISAARLVTRAKKNDHITPILQRLHWLPVNARIVFKILLITYKALHNQAPGYIIELLSMYKPRRSLRSAALHLLTVPSSNTKSYGDRAFSVAAPKLWNSLPVHIRTSDSLSSFKSLLKCL